MLDDIDRAPLQVLQRDGQISYAEFGSHVGRLTGTGPRVRIHLLNYANRPVTGLRVRVLGEYPDWKVAAYDKPDLKLEDFATTDGATEFTVPEMSTYAVIDLSKR